MRHRVKAAVITPDRATSYAPKVPHLVRLVHNDIFRERIVSFVECTTPDVNFDATVDSCR